MKALILPTLTAFASMTLGAFADDKKKDEVEKGLLLAYNDYQKENYSSVVEKLREVIKLVEEKNAGKIGEILPDKIDDWYGTDLKREDLAAVGGGVSVKRTYNQEDKSIGVKLVKDSPLIDKAIEMLANKDLLNLTGKKTYTIDGETALVEGPSKVLVAIDGEILLEITGDKDCKTADLVALARKLDFKALKKLK